MSDFGISVDISSDDDDSSLTTEEAMDALHKQAPIIAATIQARIEAARQSRPARLLKTRRIPYSGLVKRL